MNHQHRYPSSQPPSFTVTPDVPSPAGSHEISVLLPTSAAASVDYDSDMENENEDEPEEEVDQLVSDPEDLSPPQLKIALEQEEEDVEPTEAEINVSSIRKLRSGKIERIPGHTLLPQSRLESIMVADGVTGSLSMSKEAMFVLSTATEEFIKRMVQAAERQAQAELRSAISYRDTAFSTQQYQEFMFLKETVPQPILLADAFRLREEKEKEMLEALPAMATNPTEVPNGPPSHSPVPKARSKSRASVNGKEKVNGSASGSRRETKRDTKLRWGQTSIDMYDEEGGVQLESVSSSSRPPRTSRSERRVQSTSKNRSSSLLGEKITSMAPPPLPLPSEPYPESKDHGQREPQRFYQNTFFAAHEWPPGAFTGPASGFLQNPHGAFGRIQPTNPGRTIYSQEFQGNGSSH